MPHSSHMFQKMLLLFQLQLFAYLFIYYESPLCVFSFRLKILNISTLFGIIVQSNKKNMNDVNVFSIILQIMCLRSHSQIHIIIIKYHIIYIKTVLMIILLVEWGNISH